MDIMNLNNLFLTIERGNCAGSRTIIPSDTSLTCLPLHSRTVPVSDVQITSVHAYRSMDHSDARVTYIWLKMSSAQNSHLTTYQHQTSHMVAERGFSPPQQCTSERIAKHAADVLIPLLREEIVDIVRTISHERIKQRIVEKIADVPVLSIQTQLSNIVDVLDAIRKNLEQMQNDMFRVKTNHEDLVMKHIDDKITDVPVVLQKEDLEADTAKHSSVLETAVSRSTLDDEVLSRDRIPQRKIPVMTQRHISQDRI